MHTTSEFRTRFKEYAGAETYKRFIQTLHRTVRRNDSRLRFWQRDLWQSFISANPDFLLGDDKGVRNQIRDFALPTRPNEAVNLTAVTGGDARKTAIELIDHLGRCGFMEFGELLNS